MYRTIQLNHHSVLRVLRLPLLVAAVLLLILIGRPDTSLSDWGHVFVSLAVAAFVCVLYWVLYKNAPPLTHTRLLIGAGILLALAITLLRLRALAVYPPVNLTDEPWDLGWAVSILRTGHASDWIMFTNAQDVPYFYIPYAWWLGLVGTGLWEARLFTFLLCGVLIGLSMVAVRNLYGSRAAVYTGIALFCSANLMTGARIRHDIGLGIAMMGSLWLFTEAHRRHRNWLHFAAGVCMGLGLLAHYHAIVFGVMMTIALYFTQPRSSPFRSQRRQLILYVAGGSLAGLAVFLVQILPQWAVFTATRSPRIPSSIVDFINALLWHIASIPRHSQIEFLLILFGLVMAARGVAPQDRMIVWIVLLAHLALGVVAVLGLDYYVVPLTPFYLIPLAVYFARKAQRNPVAQQTVTIVFLILMIPNLLSTLYVPAAYTATNGPLKPPPPAAAVWVITHVGKDKRIVAEPPYFFWLTDYRFSVPISLDTPLPNVDLRASVIQRFGSVDAAWEALNADVFIFDPNLSTYAAGTQDLLASGYLDKHGYTRVATFNDEPQPVYVYEHVP